MKPTPKYRETPIRFSQLTVLENVVDSYCHLDDDYVLTRVTGSNPKFEEPVARRFDGLTMCICVKGTLKMLINLEEVEIKPNTLLFLPPEIVFRPMGWEGEELEGYILFLSNRFAADINIDLNAINSSLFSSYRPILELDQARIDLVIRYFDLLHFNAVHPNDYSRYIARSLVSAVGYALMAFGEEAAHRDDSREKRSRKLTYVRKFLQLVREYHCQERSISFYAGKMFISPKYLSLIIKESTGKSAGEWIDQYVISEAKNKLRYSGKNVQQIAYELNFTNQSSFGKYFKNLTGLSPTAFQASK